MQDIRRVLKWVGPFQCEPEDDELENGDLQSRDAHKPNPIDIYVGSRVRIRRMLLGMSQEKPGDRLGLTFQQVHK